MNKFIHVDLDAFFASVELLDKPQLQDMPVAVGGNKDRRGVLTTCNYIARRFGIRSAMATQLALKKCPELIVLPVRMSVYKEYSQIIQGIFRQFTPVIEPLSLDEAYLDVTACQQFGGSATLIAEAIRQQIYDETGLTASAGIAPLKYLAKVASDVNKPNGQCVISPSQVQAFIDDMPLERIPGVGKVTLAKLHAHNLYNGKDIRQTGQQQLYRQFGKFGDVLWRRCNGIDERGVVTSRIRKSIGVERTFSSDTSDRDSLLKILNDSLIPELNQRIGKAEASGNINKLVLKAKFSDFQQITRETQHSLVSKDILIHLLDVALGERPNTPLRLLGISVGLTQKANPQMTLDV